MTMLSSNASFADSVDWRMDDTTIYMETQNFEPTEMSGTLTCHFEDGSGIINASPSTQLEVNFERIGTGPLYELNVRANSLSSWVPLADLRSCRFEVQIAWNEQVNGKIKAMGDQISVVGSGWNMTPVEISNLVSNPGLAVELETQFSIRSPLVVQKIEAGVFARLKRK
jgi:hypothetical protein